MYRQGSGRGFDSSSGLVLLRVISPSLPTFSCKFSIFPLNKGVKKTKKKTTQHGYSFIGERQQVICLNVAFALIVKESLFLFRDHTHTTGLRHWAGSAAMDMEISAAGSVHTWQCFLLWCFMQPMGEGVSWGFSFRLTGNGRLIWFEHVEPGASCTR